MQAPMIARRLAEKHGPSVALRKAKARHCSWLHRYEYADCAACGHPLRFHDGTYIGCSECACLSRDKSARDRAAARATVWLIVVGYLHRKYGRTD